MADVRTRIERDNSAYRTVVTGSSLRLVNSLTETTVNVARQIAPRGNSVSGRGRRSRTLRESHEIDRASFISGNRVRGRVINTAPYARFVHDGTRGPITPRGGGWLGPWTTFSGPHTGVWFSKAVAGQAANPWLVRAYNRARQIHGQLDNVRPMSPPAGIITSSTGHTPGASHQVGGRII